MEFSIIAASGESVTVHAENWMIALGKAMPFFDMDASKMIRWVCTPETSGRITIEDEGANCSWTVQPVERAIRIVAASVAPPVPTTEPAPSRVVEPPIDETSPPPAFAMPQRSSLEPPPPPPPPPVPEPAPEPEVVAVAAPDPNELAERLFDLSMDISGSEPTVACQRVLALAIEFIPAEAGSIARGSIHGFHLTIEAAHGPVAGQLVGRVVPFGEGLVGLAFDARMPILVRDAQSDERHNKDFDQDSGFITRSVLCVPVLGEDGPIAVIQLINPYKPFTDTDTEILQTLSQTLASALGGDG